MALICVFTLSACSTFSTGGSDPSDIYLKQKLEEVKTDGNIVPSRAPAFQGYVHSQYDDIFGPPVTRELSLKGGTKAVVKTVPQRQMPVASNRNLELTLENERKVFVPVEENMEVKVIYLNDSSVLTTEARGFLSQLVAKAKKDTFCIIESNASKLGNADYNQRLSVRRSGSVVKYLAKMGVNGGTITGVKNYGESKAIVDEKASLYEQRVDRNSIIRCVKKGYVEKIQKIAALPPQAKIEPAAGVEEEILWNIGGTVGFVDWDKPANGTKGDGIRIGVELNREVHPNLELGVFGDYTTGEGSYNNGQGLTGDIDMTSITGGVQAVPKVKLHDGKFFNEVYGKAKLGVSRVSQEASNLKYDGKNIPGLSGKDSEWGKTVEGAFGINAYNDGETKAGIEGSYEKTFLNNGHDVTTKAVMVRATTKTSIINDIAFGIQDLFSGNSGKKTSKSERKSKSYSSHKRQNSNHNNNSRYN